MNFNGEYPLLAIFAYFVCDEEARTEMKKYLNKKGNRNSVMICFIRLFSMDASSKSIRTFQLPRKTKQFAFQQPSVIH